MNTTLKFLALAGVATGLLGCSSSDKADFVSFADIDSAAGVLQDQYTDANGLLLAGISPASALDIPDIGSATYQGFVGGDVDGSTLTGQLTVDVDFAAETTDSTATDFFHETDGPYTGTLTGAGMLIETPPAGASQISGNLNGTLSNGGTDYATALALEGDIVANGSDPVGAMAGFADGIVGTEVFTGVFAAEN